MAREYIVEDETVVMTAQAAPPAAVVQPVQPVQPVQAVQAVQPVQPVAVQPVVEAVPAVGYVRRRFWEFDAAAVVTSLFGVALLLVGLIAMTRAGFDGPLDEPVVDVLGFGHTTILGMVEAAFGLFLLVAGLTRSRDGAMFLSTVLGIAAVVGAVQTDSFRDSLGLESSWAWLIVVASAVVLLVNLLVPSVSTRTTSRVVRAG